MASANSFFAREVWPRRLKILSDRRALIWLIVALLAPLGLDAWGQMIIRTAPTFVSVGTALVAYAGITFAACIACATVSVSLPSGRMLAILAINADGRPPRKLDYSRKRLVAFNTADGSRVDPADIEVGFRSIYKDLIFQFVYSSYVQLILAGIGLLEIVGFGDAPIYSPEFPVASTIATAFLTFFTVYSLTQLISSLKALFNVGEIRDASLRGAAIEGTLNEFEP
jgi:hypothetical protein